MLSLGYNEYVCQGGDWGSIVSDTLSPQRRSPLTWAPRSAVSSPLSTAVRQSRRGTRTCPGALRSCISTYFGSLFSQGRAALVQEGASIRPSARPDAVLVG
jgi:hypothetical protein